MRVGHSCTEDTFLFTYIRPLVFSFELFYIVVSGPFIADYAVKALFIAKWQHYLT